MWNDYKHCDWCTLYIKIAYANNASSAESYLPVSGSKHHSQTESDTDPCYHQSLKCLDVVSDSNCISKSKALLKVTVFGVKWKHVQLAVVQCRQTWGVLLFILSIPTW